MARKTAVVVGSLGVIGRNLVHHLEPQAEWDIVGLSRRTPDFPTRVRAIAVDLLDASDCGAKLCDLTERHARLLLRLPGAPDAGPSTTRRTSPCWRTRSRRSRRPRPGLSASSWSRATRSTASHLGPFKTPAKETDPPHMPPNFYWDQEQWLRERQAASGWTLDGAAPAHRVRLRARQPDEHRHRDRGLCRDLEGARPAPALPGQARRLSTPSTRSPIPSISPAPWSGPRPTPRGANEVFNVTNGDFFRWCNLWPRIAAVFGMPDGPVQTIRLAEFMGDKAPLWRRDAAPPRPAADRL